MQNLATSTKQSWLVWFLKGVLILGTVILFGRLVELQIIEGNYFHALAEENRIKRVPITAPRGQILARGGEVLVGNEEIEREKQDVVVTESARTYLLGSGFAHASGYMGEVNEDEAGKVDPYCQEKGPRVLGSMEGRGGLEEQYACILRGVDGEELVEVDTFGKKVRTLGTKEPIPGQDLHTTIDYGLQKKVSESLKQKGSVVVSDAKGQILAFYSHPSFDPLKVSDYLVDPDLPLFNRVIGGAYHPGSVFKIITAAAALETGKINPEFTFDDQGVIKVKEFEYKNWFFTQYGKTEGAIDLRRALARSTDTFFYKAGEFVGPDLLASWANKFGLGKTTGIDIPGEVAGLVPTPDWKKRVKDENWFLGNTYHMSIGQGDLTATLLEVNVMTATIASGGRLCKPFIGNDEDLRANSKCEDLGIKKDNLEEITKGLIDACAQGGTGYPFFDFEPKVACKTGTAETEEKDKTHAWFTVFAPIASEAEVVVTVLVEKGGEGSSVAAPIAKEILQYWFHEREN